MKTSTGVELEENSATKALSDHALRLLISARCFLATFPDGYREYVLIEDGKAVFASTLFEHIAAHLDMWALSRDKE